MLPIYTPYYIIYYNGLTCIFLLVNIVVLVEVSGFLMFYVNVHNIQILQIQLVATRLACIILLDTIVKTGTLQIYI